MREVRVERQVRHLVLAALEVDDKWSGKEQCTHDTKPQPALDKVWINAEQNASNDRHQFRLPPSIHEISHTNRTGDDTEEEITHRMTCSTTLNWDQLYRRAN